MLVFSLGEAKPSSNGRIFFVKILRPEKYIILGFCTCSVTFLWSCDIIFELKSWSFVTFLETEIILRILIILLKLWTVFASDVFDSGCYLCAEVSSLV